MTEQEFVTFIFSDGFKIGFIVVISGIMLIQGYITFLILRAIVRGLTKQAKKVQKEKMEKNKGEGFEDYLKPKYDWQSDYNNKSSKEKQEEIDKLFGDRW